IGHDATVDGDLESPEQPDCNLSQRSTSLDPDALAIGPRSPKTVQSTPQHGNSQVASGLPCQRKERGRSPAYVWAIERTTTNEPSNHPRTPVRTTRAAPTRWRVGKLQMRKSGGGHRHRAPH